MCQLNLLMDVRVKMHKRICIVGMIINTSLRLFPFPVPYNRYCVIPNVRLSYIQPPTHTSTYTGICSTRNVIKKIHCTCNIHICGRVMCIGVCRCVLCCLCAHVLTLVFNTSFKLFPFQLLSFFLI